MNVCWPRQMRLRRLQSRFDNPAKYDCKIKDGAVGPGVVPRPCNFKYLQCQTTLTALTGAKDNLSNCKTGKS